MSETTVVEGGEDPSSETEETPVSEEPTTDFAAQATEYKNRFAGSQKRLTEEMTARKAADAEIESLRAWKADKEKADMTEVERLQAERDEARNEAEQARSEAQREKLARKFPLAVEFYGEDALPSEERLAALNEMLAVGADESGQEPVIDPNHPRRPTPPPPHEIAAADRGLRSTHESV